MHNTAKITQEEMMQKIKNNLLVTQMHPLDKISNISKLKEKRFILVDICKRIQSTVGWLFPGQKHHGGKAWQRKAVLCMATRSRKSRRGARDRNNSFRVTALVTCSFYVGAMILTGFIH